MEIRLNRVIMLDLKRTKFSLYLHKRGLGCLLVYWSSLFKSTEWVHVSNYLWDKPSWLRQPMAFSSLFRSSRQNLVYIYRFFDHL